MSTKGWRDIFNTPIQTVIDAIRGTLATSLLPGSMTAADFAKLATVPAGSTLCGVWSTPVVDAMSTGLTDFATPLASGAKLLPGGWLVYEYLTRDAALTTAPQFRLAQNGTDLTASSGPSTVTINGRAAACMLPSFFNMDTAIMTSFPLQLNVVTAAAGAGLSSCTLKAHFVGAYI